MWTSTTREGAPDGEGGADNQAGTGADRPHGAAGGPAGRAGRGRRAERPAQIPPKGWKEIALRLKTEIKQDQVPLLSAGVAFYALLALLIVGLAVLYRYAPDRDEPRWAWVTWGSGIATALWVAASLAFSFYVAQFGNYNETYGALAGIVILLFWLFLTALVVLVGAELNTEMELQTAKDTTTGRATPR